MKKRFTSTRILSGLLSAAMVFTMAPQTALSSLAAEDVILGGEGSAFFDAPGSAADAMDPAPQREDESLSGSAEEDVFEDADDITIAFDYTTAGSNVVFLDPMSDGGSTAIGQTGVIDSSSVDNQRKTDSTKGYSFEIAPADDYELASTISTGTGDAARSTLLTISYNKESDNSVVNAIYGKDFTIGALTEDGRRKVAISRDYLVKYKAEGKKTVSSSDRPDPLGVVASSGAGVEAYFPVTYAGKFTKTSEMPTSYQKAQKGVETPLALNQYADTPITDVKLYTTDAEGDKTILTSSSAYAYDGSTGLLTLKTAGANAGYTAWKGGGTFTIEALSDAYTITQDESSKAYATVSFTSGVVSKNGTYYIPWNTTAGGSYGNAKDPVVYSVTVKRPSGNTTRSLIDVGNKVDQCYTINGGSDKKIASGEQQAVFTSGEGKAAESYSLTASKVTGNIVLKPVTVESVIWDKSSDYTVSMDSEITGYEDTNSDPYIVHNWAVTGKDLKFHVKAASKKKVTGVTYTVAGSSEVGTAEVLGDGGFRIPGSVVTNQITLVPQVVATDGATSNTNDKKVKVGTVYDATAKSDTIKTAIMGLGDDADNALIVKDRETGVSLITDPAVDNAARTGSDYYFYAKSGNVVRYKVTGVKYAMGSVTDGEATLVEGYESQGLYVIKNVSDDITLTVNVVQVQSVTAPANEKVSVTINKTAVKPGKTTLVEVGKAVDVVVTPATGTETDVVALTKATYTIVGTGGDSIDIADGTTAPSSFTIPKESVDANVYDTDGTIDSNNEIILAAETTETLTAGFNVKFALKDIGGYGTAITNAMFEVDEDKNEVSPQNLLVARTSTSTGIIPTVTDARGVQRTLKASGSKSRYYVKTSGSNTGIQNDIINLPSNGAGGNWESDDTVAKIDGKKEGTTNIFYELQDNAVTNGNTIIYKGSLKITVKPHYVIDEITIVDGISTTTERNYVLADNTNTVKLVAKITNGATGTDVTYPTIGTNGVAATWAVTTGDQAASGINFNATAGTVASGTVTSDVIKSSVVKDEPVPFNLTLTDTTTAANAYNGGEPIKYTCATPALLYSVEEAYYLLVPTVTLESGMKEVLPGSAMKLESQASGMDKATISYSLYKGTKATINGITNAATLKNALDIASLEDVTESISDIQVRARRNGTSGENEKPSENLTLEGSGTSYTVTGTTPNKTATDIVAVATIKGQPVTSAISFDVYSRLATNKVNLVLNDKDIVYDADTTVHNKGNVVIHNLSSDYVNSRSVSTITETYNGTTVPNATGGVQFDAITTNSAFVLPVESQITPVNTKYILAGWKVGANDGATKADGSSLATNDVLAPGVTIYVTGALDLQAVWAERYEFTTYRDLGVKDSKGNPDIDASNTLSGVTDLTQSVAGAQTIAAGGELTLGMLVTKHGVWDDELWNSTTSTYGAYHEEKIYNPATAAWKAEDIKSTGAYPDEDNIQCTVVDAEKLKSGKLTGITDGGYAAITPSWTAEDGKVYEGTPFKIQVSGAVDTYKIEFTSDMPATIVEGQQLTMTKDVFTIKKGAQEFEATAAALTNGKIVWSEQDAVRIVGTTNAQPTFIGKKATDSVTLKVTYTDVNGATTSAEKTIAVTAATTKVVLTDSKGTVLTGDAAAKLEAPIDTASGEENEFYVATVNVSGAVVNLAGTWGADVTDTETAKITAGITFNSSGSRMKGIINTGSKVAGDGPVIIKFTETSTGTVYSLDVNLTTYYPVKFSPDKVVVTNSNVDKTATAALSGEITVSHGTTALEAGKAYVEKIYAKDLTKSSTFTLALDDYTAAYTGTDHKLSFAGWVLKAPTSLITNAGGAHYNAYTASGNILTALTNRGAAKYELASVFTDLAVESLSANRRTVALRNEDATATDGTSGAYYDANVATVTLFATPEDTAAIISAKSSNGGFYQMVGTSETSASINSGKGSYLAYPAGTSVKLDKVKESDGSYNYKLTLGTLEKKAGKATITVAANSGSAKETIELIVSGLYEDGAKNTHYFTEKGEDLKDGTVDVYGETLYFDADGLQIRNGLATVKDENGKVKYYVYLRSGTFISGYYTDSNGDSYCGDQNTGIITPESVSVDKDGTKYFSGADGKIQKPTVVTGDTYGLVGNGTDKVYLADNTGKILTKAAFTALGVESVSVAGTEYVVGEGDIASLADRQYVSGKVKFSAWPRTYTKGEAAPEITGTVDVYSEKQAKILADQPVTVKVTPEAVGADNTEATITFTATADLSKFYKDSTYTSFATTEEATKTYKFKDGEKTSTPEEYVIVGAPTFSGWKYDVQTNVMTVDVTADYTVKEDGVADKAYTDPKKTLSSATGDVAIARTEGDYAYYVATYQGLDGKAYTSRERRVNTKTGSMRDYTYASAKFEWAGTDTVSGGDLKGLLKSVAITYSYTEDGQAGTEEIAVDKADITVTKVASKSNQALTYYEATARTLDLAKESVSETKSYSTKSHKPAEYAYASAKFEWADTDTVSGGDLKELVKSVSITYSYAEDGAPMTDTLAVDRADITVTKVASKSTDTLTFYEAKAKTIDPAVESASDTRAYSAKTHKAPEYALVSADFQWADSDAAAANDIKSLVQSVKVTYSYLDGGKKKTDTVAVDPADITVAKVASKSNKTVTVYEATAKTLDPNKASVSATKSYSAKSGKQQAETPAKEGSEEDISWNLFYTTYDDGVGSLDIGYTGETSGFAAKNPKASKYYKMNDDGTISLLANLAAADRKKAASAANSLITMDLADNGVFAYQLPVSYAAPSLKLTATSGSIKKNGGEQTVSTIVTEKKSTGAFEPLEVTTEDLTYAGATLGLGDNAGEVTFTTSAKASGKLAVKLSGWSSPVQVSYSIREVNKDVLTATAKGLVVKQTVLNNTATAAGEAQEIQIAVNGAEPTSEAPVTVKAPNKDGGFKLTADGEDLTKGGTLTSGTLSVEYPESPASMKAGTYTYKLTTSNKGSLNVKVVVNKNALSKAVTLKQTAKMNLVTGQSLVLVPTLKGVTGTIEDVALSEADAKTFGVEFSEEKNEIVLSTAAEDTQLSTKMTYQPTINITVSGVECPIPVKFKPVATKPAVKLTKVTLSKSAAAAATAEAPVAGTCNIVSTYKLGGKTIGQAWEGIKIGGTAVEQGTPMTDTKTGLQVTYNEDGTLTVAAVAPTSKTVKNKGSIKVTVVYKNGVEVTKSLSVALK